MADLAVAGGPALPGRAARRVGEMVREFAAAAGLVEPPGLIVLVGNPAGIAQVGAIASVGGMIGLALGSEDFSLALSVPPDPEVLDLPCRLLALAAASRGVMALGSSGPAIRDRRRAVHPSAPDRPGQSRLAPSDAERHAAQRVVTAWTGASGAGVIRVDGRMVDRPVLLAAQRLLGV